MNNFPNRFLKLVEEEENEFRERARGSVNPFEFSILAHSFGEASREIEKCLLNNKKVSAFHLFVEYYLMIFFTEYEKKESQ